MSIRTNRFLQGGSGFRGAIGGSGSGSGSGSSTRTKQGAIALTLRLLLVSLTVVAFFIMIFNLLFAYTRLEGHSQRVEKSQKRQHSWSVLQRHRQKKQHAVSQGSLFPHEKSTSLCKQKFSMDSINEILQCYRGDLVKRMQMRLEQVPEHCRINNSTSKQFVIHNWTQLQSCFAFLNDKKTAAAIRTVHILGERHSGTKFVQQELQNCFPRSAELKVHRDLVRSKHFFQPLDWDSRDDYSTSLIVAVFRDPLDWVEAMRVKPYHAPFHMFGFSKAHGDGGGSGGGGDIQPLPWKTFVARPWTMPQSPRLDLGPVTNMTHSVTGEPLCRYGFTERDIIPCFFNSDSNLIPRDRVLGFEPIYEMTRDVLATTTNTVTINARRDKDATINNENNTTHSRPRPPFKNILQLRADKTWHLAIELPLLLPNLGGFVPVRYEDLLRQGMQPLLGRIARQLGMPSPPTCKRPPTGPQPHLLQPGRRRQDAVSQDYREWVLSHLHKPTETLLGYDHSPAPTSSLLAANLLSSNKKNSRTGNM